MTAGPRIGRRSFLEALFGLEFAAVLTASACKSEPTREIAGGFVDPAVSLGHRLRGDRPPDEAFAALPAREVDVAIVGGGPAGLAAAWQLGRRGVARCELFELEPAPGGTSAHGSDPITAYPWGAHYITTPMAHQRELVALLHEMGALAGTSGAAGHPEAREELLVREPKERIFHRGFWYPGLYLGAGASAEDRAELDRFEAIVERFARMRDGRGRRAFAVPLSAGSDDPEITALDRLSAQEWLAREGFRSPRLSWLLDYACRDDYGLRLAQTSAWALLFYHAARSDPEHDWSAEVITWPEGNGALVDHLRARSGARISSRRLALDVLPERDAVMLHLYDAAHDRLERVKARRAIVATPHFITRRIVRPLRERGGGGADFEYGAWLVANLTLDARPRSRGCEDAWDNVLYDSPSLGYVSATHQRGRSFGPTIWTYFLPFTDERPAAGRERLLGRSYAECRDGVLFDLERAHADLRDCVARVDVRRWGHAMVQPRVGHVFSPERRRAREPIGPLHFAHSDLSGIALFEEAFDQGVRAADAVAASLPGGPPT